MNISVIGIVKGSSSYDVVIIVDTVDFSCIVVADDDDDDEDDDDSSILLIFSLTTSLLSRIGSYWYDFRLNTNDNNTDTNSNSVMNPKYHDGPLPMTLTLYISQGMKLSSFSLLSIS